MKLPMHLLSDNFIKSQNITEDTPFEIFEVDAKELLCPARLDLAAKLFYIDAKANNADLAYAKEVYQRHIQAFSEGTYTEPGDQHKNSLEKFYEVMDTLIAEFKDSGFDPSKSLIPVGDNNVILDGAHRTACAIYFNKKVTVIRFVGKTVQFGYEYFRSRKLSEEFLETMAITYSRFAVAPLYCACIWPIADSAKRETAIQFIKDQYSIVLERDISLEKLGLRNLMIQVYQQQAWIGTEEDQFRGVMGKVDACFRPRASTKVILFEGGGLDEVLALKENIRNIFSIDKHSIHISDSNQETNLMVEVLFQANSRYALNYGKPERNVRFFELLKCAPQDTCFSEEATLAFFGFGDGGEFVSSEAVLNPFDFRSFFVFNGRKLPALTAVYKKVSYHQKKEIKKLLQRENPDRIFLRKAQEFHTYIFWESQKRTLQAKQIAAKVASRFGVYDLLHKIYCAIRKR